MTNALQSFFSFVAKASPLRTFCVLITFAIASEIVDLFVDGLLLPSTFSVVFYTIAILFILGWVLTIGTALELLWIGNLNRYQYRVCLIVGLLLILTLVSTKVYNPLNIEGRVEGTIFLCYIFGSIFSIAGFVALTLNNIESKNSNASNIIRDALLIFLWPVGVWSIQNRVSKLANNSSRIKQ